MLTWPKKRNLFLKFSYGNGHIMNDMAVSLWFTYLMLFYQNVINLEPVYAGIILLSGQIADGIATVFVGIVSDKEMKSAFCLRYGKRKVVFIFLISRTAFITHLKYLLIPSNICA